MKYFEKTSNAPLQFLRISLPNIAGKQLTKLSSVIYFNSALILRLCKGIVHLNIIFSYMKFNKICNLNYPVLKLFMLVFCYMYIRTFFILYYNSHW